MWLCIRCILIADHLLFFSDNTPWRSSDLRMECGVCQTSINRATKPHSNKYLRKSKPQHCRDSDTPESQTWRTHTELSHTDSAAEEKRSHSIPKIGRRTSHSASHLGSLKYPGENLSMCLRSKGHEQVIHLRI